MADAVGTLKTVYENATGLGIIMKNKDKLEKTTKEVVNIFGDWTPLGRMIKHKEGPVDAYKNLGKK